METTTISNKQLTVVISERGAEILSVRDAQGHERMWNGDPAFWDFHAPIMFPVCGGFKENRYLMEGESYPMSKHGFARFATWKLEAKSDDSAEYVLKKKDPGYPFEYALHAIYCLKENKIEITYRMESFDNKPIWFSVGSHEAYALAEGVDGVTLVFDKPETLARYDLVDGNLLKKEPVIMGTDVRELKLKSEYFATDGMVAMVFPYLQSRGVVLLDSQGTPLVRVDYDGMDAFLLWTKRGAGYLCIEPWCNAPDFIDTNMRIEDKKGCIWLKPGQSISKTHTISYL